MRTMPLTNALFLSLVLLNLPRLRLTHHQVLLQRQMERRELDEERIPRVLRGRREGHGRRREDLPVRHRRVVVELLRDAAQALLIVREACVDDVVCVRERLLRTHFWICSREREELLMRRCGLPSCCMDMGSMSGMGSSLSVSSRAFSSFRFILKRKQREGMTEDGVDEHTVAEIHSCKTTPFD